MIDMATMAVHECVTYAVVKSVTVSALAMAPLALRCSPDWKVDGADRICTGGLFKNKLWGYVWPPEHIRKVDFYLDGKFRRTEGYPPFELDGGAATGLGNGPHELRAVLQFKDGSKPMTLTSTFDVGKPPLRCSTDAVVDGNDQACDARTFNKPLWIYWWPQYGIKSVDFYLDGEFRRTERQPPYEFDGGAATNLAQGRPRHPLGGEVQRRPATSDGEHHGDPAVS